MCRRCAMLLVGAHGGQSGHLVLFLDALLFSKLLTFRNNNPEGNPLKSVYITSTITFTFRPMWSFNGRVAFISLSTFSQYNKLKCNIKRGLIFVAISYVLGSHVQNIGQYIEKSIWFRS